MHDEQTTVERAFALARSGKVTSVNEIRKQLKSERYESVDAHLASPALSRQLVQLIASAASIA